MLKKLLTKIKYYQEILDEIKYPILNPVSYYKNDQEYRDNIKKDIFEYKNYELSLEENILNLRKYCKSQNIEIKILNNKTIHLNLNYIDVEKLEIFTDKNNELINSFSKFKI